MSDKLRVMIMAGGTGGHVFPALAVADELLAVDAKISWLGTRRGIESELVPSRDLAITYLDIEGIRGRGVMALIRAPLLLFRSIRQALSLLNEFKPQVVLGMGGFASGPCAVAAKLKGIPVVIHEQNSVAGTTNRLSAHIARRVMQGFPNTLTNGEWCGNPVRPEIANLLPPQERLAKRKGKASLLILGGSRGALAINRLLPEALGRIDARVRPNVIHQTGRDHLQGTIDAYQEQGLNLKNGKINVVPFIDAMEDAYAWADFVICRSGALTIAELTAVGLGSLLIPFPHAIDDHQTCNGKLLVGQGAATMIQQSTLTPEILANEINAICTQPERRLNMAMRARELAKVGAAQQVAKVCIEVAHGL
jgi:UDP-N-acetylglucosamine--N-acetylmuramyl-(pentapeptide) pyrophosphoryl-undecaprenol N-acetylglucosamine transferase